MPKKKGNKHGRRNSRLKQHAQKGRTLTPPLKNIPNMKLSYWIRDELPDMLWLVYLSSQLGHDGMILARNLFNVIEEVLNEEYGDSDGYPAEIIPLGKLTAFDNIPENIRPTIIERLGARYLLTQAFPEALVITLSKYDDAPGRWIWEKHIPKNVTPEQDTAAQEAISTVINDGWQGNAQASTRAKHMVMSSRLSMGKFSITQQMAEELGPLFEKYPFDLSAEEEQRIDGFSRASYLAGSMITSMNGEVDKTLDWAKYFWRKNWELYGCKRLSTEDVHDTAKGSPEQLKEFQDKIEKELEKLVARFDSAASTDPDLYSPTRYEVLTGIVSRMVRAVSAATSSPALWSTEQGSGLVRSLVEARIVLSWLIQKNDPDLYNKFQDFGRGHLKLLKLQMEEYVDKQDSPSPELLEYVKTLDELVNQDLWEEYQEIQAGGNFAGNNDTRRMADEVGLGDDYRFIFAPASSAFHGEWTAVEQFALERCVNPLHQGHRIPRKHDDVVIGPQTILLALNELDDLVSRYERALSDA